MEDFTFGELMLIQIALLALLKDLDITLEAGIAIQESVAKTETKLKTLRNAAKDQLPESLAPDSATGK